MHPVLVTRPIPGKTEAACEERDVSSDRRSQMLKSDYRVITRQGPVIKPLPRRGREQPGPTPDRTYTIFVRRAEEPIRIESGMSAVRHAVAGGPDDVKSRPPVRHGRRADDGFRRSRLRRQIQVLARLWYGLYG